MTDIMSKAWDEYWNQEGKEDNTEKAITRVVAMVIAECAKVADEAWGDGPSGSYDNGGTIDGWNMASQSIKGKIEEMIQCSKT